jgi:hypothetical protein
MPFLLQYGAFVDLPVMMLPSVLYIGEQDGLLLCDLVYHGKHRQIGLPDVLVERRNHRQECSRYYWCLTKDNLASGSRDLFKE